MLLLFTFALFPPEEAAEVAIHLWYSASLPGGVAKLLRNALFFELYQKVFAGIKKFRIQRDLDDSFSETFKLGPSAKMAVVLQWSQWSHLAHMLANQTTNEEALKKRKKKVLDPSRADCRDKEQYALKPYQRVVREKFYEDGLVLPFGACRKHFTDPNLYAYPL